MKSAVIIIATSILFSFGVHRNNLLPNRAESVHDYKPVVADSAQFIRIINGSSLKRLPAVVKDLSIALRRSGFHLATLLNKNGIAVYLYDVTCNGFQNSAAVIYHVTDTIFHLKLNRFNRQATDNALAATLIHELMHCILLDIFNYARNGDEKALAAIASFGANGHDTSQVFKTQYFNFINSGDAGQHELIYRIFYPQMVSLLQTFTAIHHDAIIDSKEAGRLMWSGLQETKAYKKLDVDEKEIIEATILKSKGVKTNLEEY